MDCYVLRLLWADEVASNSIGFWNNACIFRLEIKALFSNGKTLQRSDYHDISMRGTVSGFQYITYFSFLQIIVLVITFGLLGVCIWGTVTWEQNFDFKWFLPADGQSRAYFTAIEEVSMEQRICTRNCDLSTVPMYCNVMAQLPSWRSALHVVTQF